MKLTPMGVITPIFAKEFNKFHKSKQVAICAPSCTAGQFGEQDKPWTGVAGAFVEQQHVFVKVSKTGKACITFRYFFL